MWSEPECWVWRATLREADPTLPYEWVAARVARGGGEEGPGGDKGGDKGAGEREGEWRGKWTGEGHGTDKKGDEERRTREGMGEWGE